MPRTRYPLNPQRLRLAPTEVGGPGVAPTEVGGPGGAPGVFGSNLEWLIPGCRRAIGASADERRDWRPKHYRHVLRGCETVLVFPVLKLLDFKSRAADPEASDNPFAPVVPAQLRDANDDMVLEAAAHAAATHLVTFNIRDFGTAPSQFGITLCRPAEIARNLRHEQK